MSAPITIIGSGFAAYQLIKTIRRTDKLTAISLFTADAGDDYNKPDLSHVFSKNQSASDLIKISSKQFASDFNVDLHPFSRVERIDRVEKNITINGIKFTYSKLVLATGADAFIPAIQGDAFTEIITLNSLAEYERSQSKLVQAKRIAIIGAGLIGTELAMDLKQSGKEVVVIDPCTSLMANMLPEFVAHSLQKKMCKSGVVFELEQTVNALNKVENGISVQLSSGVTHYVDCVISAAGLKVNTDLAKQAGLKLNKGIVVDLQLKTSDENIFAIGDCAEINGKVMPFLQPILLSANILAKNLSGEPAELKLTTMLVKVKTPLMPIQLAGDCVIRASRWQVDIDATGTTVKAFNEAEQMVGFVVTEERMKHAFPLLKQLNN
ncbi:NADH:flavorubredoxin reductase NorW [Psychromonas hadalis]|uniref:NADH:flavorubredoxin reductase NorW n=1 Tax=Psychromonas hadalis TaxID=211669 RepID=UPI0003B4E594|nr:NADH:flavorubredoxin reductase NorW [Psychromonas hadalis]